MTTLYEVSKTKRMESIAKRAKKVSSTGVRVGKAVLRVDNGNVHTNEEAKFWDIEEDTVNGCINHLEEKVEKKEETLNWFEDNHISKALDRLEEEPDNKFLQELISAYLDYMSAMVPCEELYERFNTIRREVY